MRGAALTDLERMVLQVILLGRRKQALSGAVVVSKVIPVEGCVELCRTIFLAFSSLQGYNIYKHPFREFLSFIVFVSVGISSVKNLFLSSFLIEIHA